MRIKTLRWIAAASLSLAAGCEPVGLDASPAAAEPSDSERTVARARIMRALGRSADNVRMRRLDDGTQLAEVVSGFQHATIVTKADGGLAHHCLTDPEEAVRLLEGRPK